jgi:membrane associated rhomboid family serine protease
MILIPAFEKNELKKFETGEPAKDTDMKFFLAIFVPRKDFFITPVLIDVNSFVFMVMVFAGLGFVSFQADDLINWGANFKPLTTDDEWWRLITSTFLHGGIMHLVANMVGLIFVGIFLEPRIGSKKFAVIYLVTGILASITSIIWHEATVSVGASGAIFGLYGLFLALMLTKAYPKEFNKVFLISTVVFIGFNLVIGITGGIDNAAHLGGLVSGFVIGLLLSRQLKDESDQYQLEKNING